MPAICTSRTSRATAFGRSRPVDRRHRHNGGHGRRRIQRRWRRGNGGATSNPAGITLDAAGNLYIADRTNHRIRFVSASTGFISTVAGYGHGRVQPVMAHRPRWRS